jgi:histidinol dehydrogenase
MRIEDLRGIALSNALVNSRVPRAELDIDSAVEQIRPLLADVKNRGEDALVEVAQRFDGFDPRPFKVSAAELESSVAGLDAQLRSAIETSIDRVRRVSQASVPQSFSVELSTGASVHQRWQPVDSVGLYVPGGKAVYPSSVIMNVVPAQVAGVSRLVIATPGQKAFGGRPHPTVLATAALLGVKDVYATGGPAAVAAFAYGVPAIGLEPVAMVTGPGNIFVAAAKRALRGVIGIDSEAGTTEILIVADSSADPRLVAFDLVSQAEHDEAAACVLVTDSADLVDAVQHELESVVASTEHAERVSTALNSVQSALVLVDDLAAALSFANHYATEHLELHTQDPTEDARAISNAGAIFLGQSSPVSLGDYSAGSNHVLPTGQQAKFGAGLGVHTFLRAQQLIDYSSAGLAEISSAIQVFARAEGLPGHADAVQARFE